MPEGGQLDLDGNCSEPQRVSPAAPYTPAQKEILRVLREDGVIRSKAAGQIVHLHRSPRCPYCSGIDACPWAASDGGDAMKRLAARGLVLRAAPGEWVLA